MLTSQIGRELMADVLEAVAGVLRRNRDAGQRVADVADAVADTTVDLASTAAGVTNDVVTGGAEASTRIAAAGMDMAEAAAGALARMGTQAVLNMLPGTSNQEEQDRRKERRGRQTDSREGSEGDE